MSPGCVGEADCRAGWGGRSGPGRSGSRARSPEVPTAAPDRPRPPTGHGVPVGQCKRPHAAGDRRRGELLGVGGPVPHGVPLTLRAGARSRCPASATSISALIESRFEKSVVCGMSARRNARQARPAAHKASPQQDPEMPRRRSQRHQLKPGPVGSTGRGRDTRDIADGLFRGSTAPLLSDRPAPPKVTGKPLGFATLGRG